MMMLMHHHRTEVDGHFDGLIAMRPELRAHRSTEEDQGFNWSHWLALSAGYSPHTVPAATMLIFCVAKKEVWENLPCELAESEVARRRRPKPRASSIYHGERARAEL